MSGHLDQTVDLAQKLGRPIRSFDRRVRTVGFVRIVGHSLVQRLGQVPAYIDQPEVDQSESTPALAVSQAGFWFPILDRWWVVGLELK